MLDFKAVDDAGRRYSIEVQLNPGLGDYIKRSIYYLARFYSEQIQKGESYCDLPKTISISLLDFNLFDDSEEVHTTFLLKERKIGFILSDSLELHHVELKKFKATKTQELQSRFERWLYFLKFADIYGDLNTSLPENLNQEEGIAMALESMRRAYAIDPVREMIRAREKAELDELSRLQTARLEGKAEGEAKGKAEVARNLLAGGIDVDQVIQFTGLSLTDLENL